MTLTVNAPCGVRPPHGPSHSGVPSGHQSRRPARSGNLMPRNWVGPPREPPTALDECGIGVRPIPAASPLAPDHRNGLLMTICAKFLIVAATSCWFHPAAMTLPDPDAPTHQCLVRAMDAAGGPADEAKDPGDNSPHGDPLDLEVNLDLLGVEVRDLASFLTDQVGIAVRIAPDVLNDIKPPAISARVASMPVRNVLALVCRRTALLVRRSPDGALVLSRLGTTETGPNLLEPPVSRNAAKTVRPMPMPLQVSVLKVPAGDLYSTVMSPFCNQPLPTSPDLPGTVSARFEITASMDCQATLALFMNRQPAPLRRLITPAWRGASMRAVLSDLSAAAGVTIAMSPNDLEDAPSITWTEPVTEVIRVLDTLSRTMDLSWTATTRGFLLTGFGKASRKKPTGTALELPAALVDRLIAIDVSDAGPWAVTMELQKALAVPVTFAAMSGVFNAATHQMDIPSAQRITLGVQNRSFTDVAEMLKFCSGGSLSVRIVDDRIDAVVAPWPPPPERAAPVGAPQF